MQSPESHLSLGSVDSCGLLMRRMFCGRENIPCLPFLSFNPSLSKAPISSLMPVSRPVTPRAKPMSVFCVFAFRRLRVLSSVLHPVVLVLHSITAATTPASTVDALDGLLLLQLLLGHTADAGRVEVCLLGLDATKAAELSTMLASALCPVARCLESLQ